jgi:rhodanese-related sulfurtransferase
MLTAHLSQQELDLPDIMATDGTADWFIKPPDFIPNKDDYFVIDVRPDSVYETGHIPGAVRSSFRNLLTTAKQADKPIVAVCHTGQGAAYAAVGLRLSGYSDAKVLVFGMSIWNADFDVWSSHTSDTANGHANWTVPGSAATPQTFGDPTITSSPTARPCWPSACRACWRPARA